MRFRLNARLDWLSQSLALFNFKVGTHRIPCLRSWATDQGPMDQVELPCMDRVEVGSMG